MFSFILLKLTSTSLWCTYSHCCSWPQNYSSFGTKSFVCTWIFDHSMIYVYILVLVYFMQGRLHGFSIWGMELPNFQNLATTTKWLFKYLLLLFQKLAASHLLPIGVATYSFIQHFQHYKTNNHESKWLF